MKIVQCSGGHFYDSLKYSQCPYCKDASLNAYEPIPERLQGLISRGIRLRNYIKYSGGKLKYQDALRIMLPVMDELIRLHQRGVVHHDVTPDNIFIMDSAEIKLGSCMNQEDLQKLNGANSGFLAGERYRVHGKFGPYTDIYSLAACFYMGLTGRAPPAAIDREANDSEVRSFAYFEGIPYDIKRAIIKAMAIDGKDRFQSVNELRNALTAHPPIGADSYPRHMLFKRTCGENTKYCTGKDTWKIIVVSLLPSGVHEDELCLNAQGAEWTGLMGRKIVFVIPDNTKIAPLCFSVYLNEVAEIELAVRKAAGALSVEVAKSNKEIQTLAYMMGSRDKPIPDIRTINAKHQ